jgi:hypothetical protein
VAIDKMEANISFFDKMVDNKILVEKFVGENMSGDKIVVEKFVAENMSEDKILVDKMSADRVTNWPKI